MAKKDVPNNIPVKDSNSNENKDSDKQVNEHCADNVAIDHIEVDESLCSLCMKEIPPNICKGKGGKGLRSKGKKKSTPKDIDWVFCDHCQRWYHCLCEQVELKNLGDTYTCSVCRNK